MKELLGLNPVVVAPCLTEDLKKDDVLLQIALDAAGEFHNEDWVKKYISKCFGKGTPKAEKL